MNKYQKELQALKSWDEVQTYRPIGRGYNKIDTAGHGYIVVPKSDVFASKAKAIVEYGFVGKLAYYLEEDCEATEFMAAIA